jgi:hypothetical protein
MIIHRVAQSDAEIERASLVLGEDDSRPENAQWFLALAQRPLERIPGAPVWWLPKDRCVERFHWNLYGGPQTGEHWA